MTKATATTTTTNRTTDRLFIQLIGFLPFILPFLSSILLSWYGGFTGPGGIKGLIVNPLTLVWLAMDLTVAGILIGSRIRKVDTWYQYRNDTNGAAAQYAMKKLSSQIIVLTLVINLIGSQLMLLFVPGVTADIRWAVGALTFSSIFLAGTPAYIIYIRKFEYYGREIPFDKTEISISYIARNALVLFFSISGSIILIMVELYSGIKGYTGPAEQLFTHILIKSGPLGIISILVGLLSNIFLASGINHRLGIINNRVNELAEGNLGLEPLEIMSRDELGLIFKDLNTVQQSLTEIIVTIKKSTNDTVAIKDQLLRIAQETSATTTQIAANIDSVNRQINNLDDSMGTTTRSVGEMATSLGDLGDQIGDQAAMVEQSSAATTQMIASIDSISGIARKKVSATETLISASREGGDKMATTVETMKNIYASIENIKEITSIIMSISARTNLLAMNAAIEAAHAGEAGRGFSVVADEIRKLAETSSKSSRKINDTIKEIVGQIEQSTNTAEVTLGTFGKVQSEVKEMVQSFREIEQGLAELKTGSGQIMEASGGLQEISVSVRDKAEEMLHQTESVSGSVSVVARISSETRGAAGEISHGTASILEAIEQLGTRAAELDRYASLLKQNVEKFHI